MRQTSLDEIKSLLNEIADSIKQNHAIVAQEIGQITEELKLEQPYDISEEDPITLLDALDEAAKGNFEDDVLSKAHARWKAKIQTIKLTTTEQHKQTLQ